jgi:5-methylcytosine-specific restriction endonuclease McrA
MRVAKWRKDNPGRRNASDQRYREKNREKCREATKKSAAKKPELYKEKTLRWHKANPERVKAASQRYKRKNREKVYFWNNNRRARLMNAKGSLSFDQWETIIQMHDHRCVYCYQKLETPTQEHIVPLSSGGRHDENNVVPACLSCNSRKGSRSLLRFLCKEVAI